MSKYDDKLKAAIHELVANFLQRESNKSSLVTVTRVELTENAKKAIIFITVLPDEKQAEALSFARRQRTEIREKLMTDLKLGHPPFIEVEIDKGEKNRQRLDELS
jgi:ribosome-binding factor A